MAAVTIKPKYVANGTALSATSAIAASAVNGYEIAPIDFSSAPCRQVDIHVSAVISNGQAAVAADTIDLYWYPVVKSSAAGDLLPAAPLTGSSGTLAAVRTSDLRYLGSISPVVRNTTHTKTFTVHNPGIKMGLVAIANFSTAGTPNTATLTITYNGINDEAV